MTAHDRIRTLLVRAITDPKHASEYYAEARALALRERDSYPRFTSNYVRWARVARHFHRRMKRTAALAAPAVTKG